MRALDLLPRLDAVAPEPETGVPAFLVYLAVDEGQPSPGWGELRDWLCADRGINPDEAEALILAALTAEEVRARLSFEMDGWEVRITDDAARAVLLRYAVHRFEAMGLDLDEHSSYRAHDRWLVLAMFPELIALARGEEPRSDPATYRSLLRSGARA